VNRDQLIHLKTSDVSRGSLTAEQVAELEDALTRHYGERVAPVSKVCAAIGDYVTALREGGEDGPYSGSAAEAIREHGPVLLFFARKSNLLWRLIYLGQPLRTQKCPEHRGHWSGCDVPGTCACQVGTDVTGWLP
jgi:hypothetical protein